MAFVPSCSGWVRESDKPGKFAKAPRFRRVCLLLSTENQAEKLLDTKTNQVGMKQTNLISDSTNEFVRKRICKRNVANKISGAHKRSKAR